MDYLPLEIPELKKQRAYNSIKPVIYTIKGSRNTGISSLHRNLISSTASCDICQCMVKLKKCMSCNTSFICPYCSHHYNMCNHCCEANVMIKEYLTDRLEHYKRLKYANMQIKRLNSYKPPVLFGHHFPVLYNDMRVERIIWQHKNLFNSIGI